MSMKDSYDLSVEFDHIKVISEDEFKAAEKWISRNAEGSDANEEEVEIISSMLLGRYHDDKALN